MRTTPRPKSEGTSIYLKIITGLVSAMFTLTLVVGTNIFDRLDDLNDKFELVLPQVAANKTANEATSKRVDEAKSAIADLAKQMQQYAMLPDKIRIVRGSR